MSTKKPPTGIEQDGNDQQHLTGIDNETKQTKTEIKEVLDNTAILSTMEFLLMSEQQGAGVKSDIQGLDIQSLKDAAIIDFSYKKNGQGNYSDFQGLDVALDKIVANPEKKILLTSLINVEGFLSAETIEEDKKNKLKILLSKPNVKFLEVPYSPQDLLKVFDRKEGNEIEESNETILSTIQFHESRGWNPYLKDFFSTLDLAALHLRSSIVVDLRPDDGKSWDDITGLTIAYETFQKHPESKIILCSLIPLEVFQTVIASKKPEDEIKGLLQGKNVRIIQSSGGNSMTQEEVLRQFDGMYPKEEKYEINDGSDTFKQLLEIASESAFQKIMESEISHFLHDANYWIDKDQKQNMIYEEQLEYFFFGYQGEKSDKRLAYEDKFIALLQMQHPSFKLLPRANNLQWIIDMYKYARMQMLPEGTRFEGVFVDRDGTLYDNKNLRFNQNIIEMIKDYEKKGKKIVIRTGGNIEMKQKLLDEIGLEYKIENKTDYKGGTVEIAIDNDSQEFLLANAKITSEQHIKI